MPTISEKLIQAIIDNREDVNSIISQKPNWNIAKEKFNHLFLGLSNPNDSLWSSNTLKEIQDVYFKQRDSNNCSKNITIRTLEGLPNKLKNDTKIIFLQIADCCCFFNASHKVNFDSDELPENFNEIKMIPSKSKGNFTYHEKTPSLYAKISLTFDYWIPKILEWTEEVRNKGIKEWQGEKILEHESCTDFMRLSLMFLSDIEKNPPFAKADDRIKILSLLGDEFVWVKKSAKREDIAGNNHKIIIGLKELNNQTGIEIPIESWSRLAYSSFLKPMIK